MYVPKKFEAPSIEAVEQYIRENGFATLTGYHKHIPIATHIPLMIKDLSNGDKTLVGHISAANPQTACFDGEQEMMAVFMENHTYISSSWYDHINVPTWNYIAVHVYGKVRKIVGDELRSHLHDLTHKYEGDSPSAFKVESMPEDMLNREIKGIVGLEMDVTKVEASYKLSQNRDDKNYKEIIKKLEERGDELSVRIAAEMSKLRS